MKKILCGKKMITVIAAGWTALALVTAFLIWPYITDMEKEEKINHVTASNFNADRNTHAHATLAVFVNGNLLNFSSSKYQNRDMLMHFEGGDGFTLHRHFRYAWLGPFFESLNMSLGENCLVINNGSSYCSNLENQVMFFVNDTKSNKFEHYVPGSGDRILVSYGTPDEIKMEQNVLDSMTNQSSAGKY
ncbi:MAG: hypothetical protein KGH81_02545 [Thaumarchaeota archaeon]|nr:hypothetical protein [Nitrososphaerota archaeon]MDE1841473.1 hypothetical protein [Nitrososphaerota archaeon]MDE1878403.1 hypothetical protein [Nitrososphaerota archaeon]